MTVPKQRNESPSVPPARPSKLVVGERKAGGQVTVWLTQQDPARPFRVGLNAAYLTGISVEIDLADAADLRAALTVLLEQVGWHR